MTKAIACELPRRTKQPVSRLYVPDIRAELMEPLRSCGGGHAAIIHASPGPACGGRSLAIALCGAVTRL